MNENEENKNPFDIKIKIKQLDEGQENQIASDFADDAVSQLEKSGMDYILVAMKPGHGSSLVSGKLRPVNRERMPALVEAFTNSMLANLDKAVEENEG